MPTLNIPNLFARRSVRRYQDRPVGTDDIRTLLDAAMAAPSAANRKPWHFVVVTDKETLAALSQSTPFARMVADAPVCIVPCGEPALGVPSRPDYWIQDLSAATENLLLAATALDLGAVWCGIFPIAERVQAARGILNIPDEVIPFAYVAIGYPEEQPEARTQYDPDRVRKEHW